MEDQAKYDARLLAPGRPEEKAHQDLSKPTTALKGFADDDNEDLIMPRVKIMQMLSPEVIEKKRQPGEIIQNLDSSQLLPELFIPIFKYSEWIRFNPQSKQDKNYNSAYKPGAIIYRTKDKKDLRVIVDSEWKDNLPPVVTKIMQFVCYFIGVEFPIVLGFSKTSFKTGKKLLSLAKFAQVNMFERQYKLKTAEESSDEYTYFIYTVNPEGKPSAEDGKKAKEFFNALHSQKEAIITEEDEAVCQKKDEWEE